MPTELLVPSDPGVIVRSVRRPAPARRNRRPANRVVSDVTVSEFLYVELIAAVVLAAWLLVRYPHFGPRSIGWALLACLGGLAAPKIGLTVLPLVLRLPLGPQLALFAVVLPVFTVMFLTVGWLMRAFGSALGGGPRGGHPIRPDVT
jgi:hypothetical protein